MSTVSTTENNQSGQPLDLVSTDGLGLEPERAAFETWVTDGWKYPKTAEKDSERQYKLMQTYRDWTVWQACWPLARAAIYSAEQAQIEAPLRAEIERLKQENFTLAAGQCVHSTATEYGMPRCAAMAQMREALRRVHKWGSIAPNYSYDIASGVEKWFKGGERGELPPLPDWEANA